MPVKLLMVALLATVLSPVAFCQWVPQQSNGTHTIHDIQFLTENIGFIGTSNSIYKTINGGGSWTSPQYPGGDLDVQLLSASHIHDIHFFDQSSGLMTGSGFFNGYDIVAKTTDGGATWRLVYHQAGTGDIFRVPLKSMTFINANTGFIAGGNGKILKTSDAGNTWQTVASGTTKNLRKVVFTDSQTGFIAGEKVILKTTNGGTSWTVTESAYTLNDLHFLTASSAVATTLEGYILKTSDGGANWSAGPVNFQAMLGKMAFDGQTGYAIGFDGMYPKFILKTTDGGNLWEQQFPPANNYLDGITIAPGGKAWAGGLNGKIFATTNGGGPSYPVASFTTSSTVYCEGITYNFTNGGPENTYTYEWRVDGVLKATTRNYQTTFEAGSHKVELTAIKGQLTGKSEIEFYVEMPVAFSKPALQVTFENGLCAGSTTVVSVKNPEWGTYRLYSGNTLLAVDDYAYNGVYLQTSALQTATPIRVTATRTNSCMTAELSKDTTIAVYDNLTQNSSISVVKNYFCNSGDPKIQVTSTKNYLKYDVYVDNNLVASAPGNGQTLVITAPSISDTTDFNVKAQVINGVCSKWFDQTLQIDVENVKADFHLSSMNASTSENIKVYNQSEGAINFQWIFSGATPSASTAANPPLIKFFQEGTPQVKLTATSASGCSHVATKTIHTYEDGMLKPTCWANSIGAVGYGNHWADRLPHPDVAVTHDDNIIVAGAYSYEIDFDSKVGLDKKIDKQGYITNYLAKYNSKGVLQWAFNTSRDEMDNTKVLAAPDGSIYLLTSDGSYEPIFYSANGDSLIYYPVYSAFRQYIIKYNSDGILQWVRAKRDMDDSREIIRDMGLDEQGNLYFLTDAIYKLSPAGDIITSKKMFDNPYGGIFRMCKDGSWYFIVGLSIGPETRITKFSASNEIVWENTITAPTAHAIQGAAVGSDNSLVLSGTANHTSVYKFQSQGEADIEVDPKLFFVVKYDASGKISWINTTESGGQTMTHALAMDEGGMIAIAVRSLADNVITSQDGNNFSLSGENAHYLIKYDPQGNFAGQEKIFGEARTPAYITGLAFKDNQTYVTGSAFNQVDNNGTPFGPVPMVNGDLILTSYEWSYFIAKFGSACELTYPASGFTASIDELVLPGEPICPGTVLHVTYNVSGAYIEPDNVFTVLIDTGVGASFPVGSFASSSSEGTIEITIPLDIDPNYTYNVRVWGSKPRLYSGALDQKLTIMPVSDPTFSHAGQDLVYNFSATGYAENVDCKWTIEGETIEERSYSHTFSQQGMYEVCLTVTDQCGVERTTCENIYVTCAPVPTDFSYTISGKTVTFTGITNPANQFLWKFGDGSTATTLNAVHTFATYGEQRVCFESSTACQTGISCRTINLACTQGNLGFDFAATERVVQFTNTSDAEFTEFEWNFGDGTTSVEKNPQHTYATPRVYTVTLKSTGKCGEVKTLATTVTVTCLMPTVDFTTEHNGLEVKFISQATNGDTHFWEFHDGATSNEVSPTHTYAAPNNYTVCLTVTNSCSPVVKCKPIIVTYPHPVAPSNLTATAISTSGVKLQWTDNSNNEGAFFVRYKETGKPTFQYLAMTEANATEYTTDVLLCNKSYTFQVSSVAFGNMESPSNEASATTFALTTTVEAVDNSLRSTTIANQYQWYFDEEVLVGATNREVTPEASGSYKVEVTKSGCTAVSAPFEFILTATEEEINSAIAIYPVPANDILTVDFSKSTLVQNSGMLSLIDAVGHLSVESKKLSHEERVDINVSKLTPGLYVLVMDLGQRLVYRKITIK